MTSAIPFKFFLQISPPDAPLYVTLLVYIMAGMIFVAAAVDSHRRYRRPLWVSSLLMIVGVSCVMLAAQYARLTVPGFPGYGIESSGVRPFFLLSGIGALLTSISVFYVGRLERERETARSRMLDMETERRHEREETLREREALIREKEAIIREKEDFVSVALHEINTPLTLLTGYAAMLMEADTLEKAQQHAEGIIRSAGRFRNMKRFSDTLLRRMILEPIDLSQIIASVLDDPDLHVATRKQPGDVTITSDCTPTIIEADLFKIQTAVMELIRNALKACDEGGHVHVECRPINGNFVISVADDGIGIHPDDYQRIWHPGVQVFDNVMTRRNEGTGYGLYMVRRVAEDHGGRAVLERSELGSGSTFSIYLPRRD